MKNKLQTKEKAKSLLILCWFKLKRKRKLQFCLSISLMILTALSEVLSIASVFPILLALSDPKNLEDNTKVQFIMNLFNIQSFENILTFIIIGFIFIILISAFLRLLNLWICTKLSASIGSDFSSEAYEKTLYQSYDKHIERNTSEIISTITVESNQTVTIIDLLLRLSTSLFTASLILLSLLLINWKLAIVLMTLLTLIYYLISLKVKKQLKTNGKKISINTPSQLKSLNEGLGSIREVLLNNSQNFYSNLFQKTDLIIKNLQAKNKFLADSPKFVIEAISLIILITIPFYLKNNFNNFNFIIPSLGIIVFSLQKLLPSIQNIYASWAIIQSKSPSLRKILDLLEQKVEFDFKNIDIPPIKFRNSITLKNIYFKYKKNKNVLENINLIIKKGEVLGIKGVTGSGKTTLINIIMGLLKPSKGSFYIDNLNISESYSEKYIFSWMKKIALVPQDIYLTDNSFLENIAFGVPHDEINSKLVRECARKSLIENLINESRNGYKTNIGEKGIKLSGGQRQRIAIARALYKKAEVIILDEATSALDNYTEDLVMKSINGLSKNITIIMIAHRLSTLENCDRVLTLKNGKIA